MEKPFTICISARIPIEYDDVVQWLTQCQDPNKLKTVSVMAARFADQAAARNMEGK